jgi:hypothetical protein
MLLSNMAMHFSVSAFTEENFVRKESIRGETNAINKKKDCGYTVKVGVNMSGTVTTLDKSMPIGGLLT